MRRQEYRIEIKKRTSLFEKRNGKPDRVSKSEVFSNTLSGKLRWSVSQTHRQKSFLNRRYKAGKNVHTLNKAKKCREKECRTKWQSRRKLIWDI